MSYMLKWTPESIRTFNKNLEYLAKKWGSQVVLNFIDRVDEVLEIVQSNPKIYQLHSKDRSVYRCVVNKRVILYFRIVDQRIDLLTFWNTYQDPDRKENI